MSDQASRQQKTNGAWELAKRHKKKLAAAIAGGALLAATSICGVSCPKGEKLAPGSFSCIPC